MRPRPVALLFALAWALSAGAAPAWAQAPPGPTAPPSPQQRQAVVDLSYVLGEAHALHRACAGPQDNTWRSRMSRLLQTEQPDDAYRQRLMQSFNAGFVARKAEFPTCTVKSAAAEQEIAAHGRDLARILAGGVTP